MSLKDLDEMGILLPKEKWGKSDLHTSVNKPQLVASGVLALAGSVLAYAGNGGTVTWVGVIFLFVFLGWFIRISLKAVDDQNEEVDDFLQGK